MARPWRGAAMAGGASEAEHWRCGRGRGRASRLREDEGNPAEAEWRREEGSKVGLHGAVRRCARRAQRASSRWVGEALVRAEEHRGRWRSSRRARDAWWVGGGGAQEVTALRA